MKKNGALLCVGATATYWATIFVGPAIIMLLNNVGYYVSGGGWGPGSFMHTVLEFASQPLACFAAYALAKSVSQDEHPVCVLSNTIVASCMCVIFVFTASSSALMWTMIVSVIICVMTATIEGRELSANTGKIETIEKDNEEVEKIMEQISKMERALSEHDKSFVENRKILAESYTDAELQRMVSNGEFPADCVSDYVAQRENLSSFIKSAPRIREIMVQHINDLKDQLAGYGISEDEDGDETIANSRTARIFLAVGIMVLLVIIAWSIRKY